MAKSGPAVFVWSPPSGSSCDATGVSHRCRKHAFAAAAVSALVLTGCAADDTHDRIYVHIQITDGASGCDAEGEAEAAIWDLPDLPGCPLEFKSAPAILFDESGNTIGTSDNFGASNFGFWAADIYSEPTESLTVRVQVPGCADAYDLTRNKGTQGEALTPPGSDEAEMFVVEEYYLTVEDGPSDQPVCG